MNAVSRKHCRCSTMTKLNDKSNLCYKNLLYFLFSGGNSRICLWLERHLDKWHGAQSGSFPHTLDESTWDARRSNSWGSWEETSRCAPCCVWTLKKVSSVFKSHVGCYKVGLVAKSGLTKNQKIGYLKKLKTSTTPSCSGPIPAKKSRGNSVLGVVFSHTMPKLDFRYTKLIYHMPWLYQYPPLPFHRSYTN